MSKQTINIGASPNDGTGTPLRTSFDYTNQNFTELYTALGGGVGLPGATTQVIFNDGGTNLAGDAGLTFNKTTDTLSTARITTSGDAIVCSSTGDFYVGSTVTPQFKIERATGNATITGDLTVRTTGLVVNATGVGIGSATTGSKFYLYDAGAVSAQIVSALGGGSNLLLTANATGGEMNMLNGLVLLFKTANTERYRIASDGTSTWSVAGTTAMTLNSTGLLVGTTSALASGSTFQNLGINRQVLTLKGDTAVSYTSGIWNASTTGDALFQYFATETSLTVRGGISYNRAGGLVAYNTTSDYRAKDIIGPVSNSGSLIDSLKVYVGKMHGATIERPMLIAHEAQEVAPYAVTGLKDEVDADGNPKYQQMDVSALVPVLIAEIQSLRARVQTLEAK
jgi:hypothetical protein